MDVVRFVLPRLVCFVIPVFPTHLLLLLCIIHSYDGGVSISLCIAWSLAKPAEKVTPERPVVSWSIPIAIPYCYDGMGPGWDPLPRDTSIIQVDRQSCQSGSEKKYLRQTSRDSALILQNNPRFSPVVGFFIKANTTS